MKTRITSAIRAGAIAACIAIGMLATTSRASFAQEASRYQVEISGAPAEAFPMNLNITFQDGTILPVTINGNGTSDMIVGSHGPITTIDHGSWYVNTPPGPGLPPGKIPWPVAPVWCLYYWYTWAEIPDAGGNGASLWELVYHEQWELC